MKTGLILYYEYETHFALLSNEELGELIRAIMKYDNSHEESELNGMVKMAFSFIKKRLDDDKQKYEEKCESNKENGTKGGRPKTRTENLNSDKKRTVNLESKKKRTVIEKTERLISKPKKPEYDNDNDYDNESVITIKKESKGDNVVSFDSVIENYTSNEKLKKSLVEFIKMRKLLKKPLTNNALELLCKELDKLARDDIVKLEIVNQSIRNSWQGFFELKQTGGNGSGGFQNGNSASPKKYGDGSEYAFLDDEV